jgi:hypothetical protein
MFQKHFSQWTLNVETVHLRLQFLTFRFDSPLGLFGYLPEPIKERSLLSRDSQQRESPLPMRFPPDSKTQRHRSLPHPDLRCYEATLQLHGTILSPMRASLDPLFLKRSSPSRHDQVVQRLSTTMKTVAKGILKNHLVLVADSMMSIGIKKRFNNAGYKATFRPLKVQVSLTESTLFTPMKCMRRLQRDAILILGMCGVIMFMGQACSTCH